ncbi:hypothetical protein FNV43_RR11406 [Rhamnella rubrinervis]|uniref:mitogen-activated protein kinase kinase kinase n=1 Tax=Rhamnella rubrinervis TaxID=2594499 RepID=A0A8K0MHP7_9ROSA|nr:hypothetical protein FNV43_RR11406 [Rhamnella rubrinervis]
MTNRIQRRVADSDLLQPQTTSSANGAFKRLKIRLGSWRFRFRPSTSASSCSSYSLPTISTLKQGNDDGNAANFLDNGRQSLNQRRLTRQRKLRHVTEQDLGLPSAERSRSSPVSPDSSRNSRSPCRLVDHWSSFAMPQPLPLPGSYVIRRPDSTPVEGVGLLFERKHTDQLGTNSSKTPSVCHRRLSEDVNVGSLHYNSGLNASARNTPTTGISSPVSPQRSTTREFLHSHVATNSLNGSNNHNRGFTKETSNRELANYNLRLNIPSRSAPTSVLSSPAVSPRRSNTGDLFHSYAASQEFHDGNAGFFPMVSPMKTVHNSPDHSPFHSPLPRSPRHNSKSPNRISFHVQHKSPPQTFVERPESNHHVTAHPLPLPPGATAASPSATINYSMESPYAKGQWQKGKLIGRGTFGSVYEATNIETGALCAMKEVDLIPDDPKSAECIKQLEQEIKVLQHLKHPNIVQYYGSEIVDDHFYIYLEYVHPGSINKYVREHCGAITECVVRNFTRHILLGLAYLHSTKTIHRDIKGANLLVDNLGTVKLADFGMAKLLTGQSYDLSLKGSPYWMAPEVIKAVMQKDANPDLALAVDIWSLGCTVIEMLNGKPPWSDFTGPQAMFKVLNKTPPIPDTLSPEGKDFLSCCFRRNPAERPSAMKLLEHPFVRNLHDQNVSTSSQAISAMTLMDKFHSPRDGAKHKVDFMPFSPHMTSTSVNLPYSRLLKDRPPSKFKIHRLLCANRSERFASRETHRGRATVLYAGKIEVSESLINRIYSVFSDGLHFAKPISSFRTKEVDVVGAVLQMLQGFSSSLFYWDGDGKSFRSKSGIYLEHLSQTSLHAIVNQFTYAATCLQLVQILISKAEKSVRLPSPTLRAFSNSVSSWLKRLRDIALKEQAKIRNDGMGITPTLLGLANSLSSLCSGAEYLLQIVDGAIPRVYFESNSSVPAADLAVHILDYLYKKLDEVCLVRGGEEENYRMLLHIFVGSLLPYVEGLDSWLFEGTLDDPFEEMFFYANSKISVDEDDFWEKSYILRQTQSQKLDAGLSDPSCANSPGTGMNRKGMWNKGNLSRCQVLQKEWNRETELIRHIPVTSSVLSGNGSDSNTDDRFSSLNNGAYHGQSIAGLTLSEVFCVSLAGFIGYGDYVSRYLCQDDLYKQQKVENHGNGIFPMTCSEKIWYKFLVDTQSEKRLHDVKFAHNDGNNFTVTTEEKMNADALNRISCLRPFCPENPAITVCQMILPRNRDAWKTLNLSRNFHLPSLNDEVLRKAIFGKERGLSSAVEGTNFTFGFHFGESEYLRSQDDTRMLEMLFPFPTLIPSFQDDHRLSNLLPFQKNSTLPSKVLCWLQTFEPISNPLPVVIMQECLAVYIKKQVDCVGRHILSKLMNDWQLVDELAVLRAIYLLGSGDMLQHFLTVIFNKLDKGETWDDDFELNTILQESIRNSADGVLLTAPDSLVVSITKTHGLNVNEQLNTPTLSSTPRKSRTQSFGIDGLDLLKFTYKVSWPLELIANAEAIKKYNQVMGFLLKVKRAKFVLDKARRWMWMGRGTAKNNYKHHWLVEQKLLHFVDAFHQYVMDRVYHSAWRELNEGMEAARSLDEVIEVHESYLLSIQRQCFVVPDKLWALIASRVNSILGLALDFYSVQQTLSSGAVSAIKAKCEMEVDRIDKQFDDCIAFLLRVLSFKLNVGHFPHLADLVTRINYNYFYMSDNGNLKTVPSSENASARMGKAFVGRTD